MSIVKSSKKLLTFESKCGTINSIFILLWCLRHYILTYALSLYADCSLHSQSLDRYWSYHSLLVRSPSSLTIIYILIYYYTIILLLWVPYLYIDWYYIYIVGRLSYLHTIPHHTANPICVSTPLPHTLAYLSKL